MLREPSRCHFCTVIVNNGPEDAGAGTVYDRYVLVVYGVAVSRAVSYLPDYVGVLR